MRKTDKNGFIKIIEECGLNPAYFKASQLGKDENDVLKISLDNSPFYFIVRTNDMDIYEHNGAYVKYTNYFKELELMPNVPGWLTIEEIYESMRYWINHHIKPYLEDKGAIDLWGILGNKNLLTKDPLDNRDGSQFNEFEKEIIRTSLKELVEEIKKQFELTEGQLEVVNDRISYISERLDKLNKTDWQGIVISAILSIATALSLDTTQGKILLDLFKHALTSVSASLLGH